MSAKKSTTVVSVNWEGLKRFLGWEGTISDLKQVELDRPAMSPVGPVGLVEAADAVATAAARVKR